MACDVIAGTNLRESPYSLGMEPKLEALVLVRELIGILSAAVFFIGVAFAAHAMFISNGVQLFVNPSLTTTPSFAMATFYAVMSLACFGASLILLLFSRGGKVE